MSVIQSIREKYAKWAVVAIALALLGFILTDYFQAKERMGGAGSTTIGTVNGKKIDWERFDAKVKARDAQSDAQAKQRGGDITEAERKSNNETQWNVEVERIIMTPSFEKVGIEVGKKEFNEWLFGSNPPRDMVMNFGDQQGNYDGATVLSQINELKRSGKQEQIDLLDDFLASLEYTRKLEKYNSFLTNSVYYPKWYVEKQNAEAAGLARVSYVTYPFSKIPDSTVKVSDKEIEDYVSKYKEQYKQEESRSIAYVIFDASPSAADSAKVKEDVEKLRADFATTTEPARFISRNSVAPYADAFFSKALLQQLPSKDSILPLSKGAIYGPYLDQHTYVMAKKIDEKLLPDTVFCRHILMRTAGEGAIPDSIAEKRIDSAIKAIEGGASFVSVMKSVSMDAAANSQDSLGIMRFSSMQIQDAQSFDPDFGKYILFDGTKGQRKKLKTKFGYHYIEIVDHKNIQQHYKIAYLAKKIIASDETERVVVDEASKFSTDSKDLKTFEANIAKSNGRLTKLEAANVGPNDISIPGIDQMLGGGFGQVVPCRKLVKEIYKADKNDVLKQEKIGSQISGYKYVVAIVTDVLEKGTQPAHVARPRVEPLLMKIKRAEQVKKMIASATTLEAVAGIFQDSIKTTDSLRMNIQNNRTGFPPKVIGAIFNAGNKGKLIPEAFAGDDRVFVIRPEDITSTSVLAGDIEFQKAQVRRNTMGLQTQFSNPIMIMRRIANIKDDRRNYY